MSNSLSMGEDGTWEQDKWEPSSFEEALDQILGEIKDTLIKKNNDYGHLNMTKFGEIGALVRVNDKIARLNNLLMDKGKEPNNESIDDSWEDIGGYAILVKLMKRGWLKEYV